MPIDIGINGKDFYLTTIFSWFVEKIKCMRKRKKKININNIVQKK